MSANPSLPTFSDAQIKSEIKAQFNKGKTAKTELYGILRTKCRLGRDRYFGLYESTYAEWAKIKAYII